MGGGLRGLGQRLIGLREGDERLIRLSPPEGFGHWDPGGILFLPEDRLEGDLPREDGAPVRVRTRSGFTAVCRLYRLGVGRLALDFNHLFAGQPITLFVQVRRVLPPSRPAAAPGGARRRASARRPPADR